MQEFEALLEQHRNEYPVENRDFGRIAHYYRQFCARHSSDYGVGHGLFALYASLPVLLTPDLLHKLRFNFKNFQYLDKPQAIHPVAVSDLLMSSLCRQVKSNTYEMPEPVRFFLLSLLRKCAGDTAVAPWLKLPYEDTDKRIADFTRYYAAHTTEPGSPYASATTKALQLNADMYLSPAKALEQMAREMEQAAHDPSRQHRLAVIIEQALNSPEAQQAPISGERAYDGAQLQLLLTYTRALKKFYLEGATQSVRTDFEDLLSRNAIQDKHNITPVLLPIPKKITGAIRKPSPAINQNIQLALTLIRKEQETKTGYLELGRCGLRYDNPDLDKVWNELEKLTHLETLILSNSWMPSSGGKMEQSINTGPDNVLTHIPDCILRLARLKRLIIRGDHPAQWGVKTIENLHTLTNLKYLDLSNNRISKLERLKNLKQLEELRLSNNQISSINSIKHLTQLRTLFLTNQKITNVEGLAEMPALQRIDLSHNPIKDARPLLPFLPRKNKPLKWVLKAYNWETEDGEINLHSTELSRDHLELIPKGSEAILEYYDDLQKKSARAAVFARRFNPYFVGRPIKDSKDFYGREIIIRLILNGIHRNSFLIADERRIGKTSLLYELRNRLEDTRGTGHVFYPVYLSVQGVDGRDFWRVLGSHLFSIISKSGSLSTNHYDFYDLQKDVSLVWYTLGRYLEKGEARIVILMDDIDQFQSYDIELLSQFRRLLQEEPRLGVVMAGDEIERYFDDVANPLYNALVTLELGPLDRKSAQALIAEPVQGMYEYAPEAVELILTESLLKPMAIQTICYHAVNNMFIRIDEKNEAVIALADVEGALKVWKRDVVEPSLPPKIPKGKEPLKHVASIHGYISGKSLENPYIDDTHIDKDIGFYNRKEIVDKLTKNQLGVRYLLQGTSKIGKTSLLHYVKRQVIASKTGLPVFVDIADITSFSDFAYILKRAIYDIIRILELPKISLEDLSPYDIIHRLLNYTSHHKRRHHVLLIDNIHQILSLPDNEFEQINEVLNFTKKNLTYIMTCTPNLESKYLGRVSRKSFMEVCEIMTIIPFSRIDAENLIRQTQSVWGEVKIDSSTLKSIIQYCGTHPYLIQKICHELYGEDLTWLDLELTSDIRSYIESDFRHLTKAQQEVLLQFSWEKSLNSKKINGYTPAEVQKTLSELEQLALIRQVDTGYELGNYFLAQWIAEYQAAMIPLGQGIDDLHESLRLITEKRNFIQQEMALPHNKEKLFALRQQLEEVNKDIAIFRAKQDQFKEELALSQKKLDSDAAAGKKIFFSYSKNDRPYLDELLRHLSGLRLNGKIQPWIDLDILSGEEWDSKIKHELLNADIFVLLLSPDLLNTDHVWDVDIATAMARHEKGRAVVVPVVVRPCDWKELNFFKIEVLPKDPRDARIKPVSLWQNRDEAWMEVVRGIKSLL